MTSSVSIESVFIADFIGCLLLLHIILTKGWKIPTKEQESRIILILTVVSIINCVIDPLAFYFDGKPGAVSFYILFSVNSVLFLYNLAVGLGVVFLVNYRLRKTITTVQKVVVGIMLFTEVLLLVINIFVPTVFYIDSENHYHREKFYMVFVLFGFALIIYSWGIYAVERLKNGSLRYFPVWQFMMPAFLCIAIQTMYYGISIQPVGYAVSFTAIVTCFQNECIYIDKLTGTFNRYELDKIIETLKKKKSRTIAAIMLDLNDFKAINDNYSHSEGDAALVAVANILNGVVQNRGMVTRFAGDEFIIVINKADETTVPRFREEIERAVAGYNERSGKPYALSVAIGGDVFDMNGAEEADFLKRIDELMYINKSEYYKSHDRRGHRGQDVPGR